VQEAGKAPGHSTCFGLGLRRARNKTGNFTANLVSLFVDRAARRSLNYFPQDVIDNVKLKAEGIDSRGQRFKSALSVLSGDEFFGTRHRSVDCY
jgi:hypothetical protein